MLGAHFRYLSQVRDVASLLPYLCEDASRYRYRPTSNFGMKVYNISQFPDGQLPPYTSFRVVVFRAFVGSLLVRGLGDDRHVNCLATSDGHHYFALLSNGILGFSVVVKYVRYR